MNRKFFNIFFYTLCYFSLISFFYNLPYAEDYKRQVLVESFTSINTPRFACLKVINISGLVLDDCSNVFSLQNFSLENLEHEAEIKRYILVLDLLQDKANSIRQGDLSYSLINIFHEDGSIENLPIRITQKNNLYFLSQFDKDKGLIKIKELEALNKQLNENLSLVKNKLSNKRDEIANTPEGIEYLSLEEQRKSLIQKRDELSSFVLQMEKLQEDFQKNHFKTPDHKTTKTTLSTQIKKLVEMNLDN